MNSDGEYLGTSPILLGRCTIPKEVRIELGIDDDNERINFIKNKKTNEIIIKRGG